MLKKILTFTTIICATQTAFASERLQKERFYQNQNCDGTTEYKLPDNTRVDCLTKEYAIEYDFANKWPEAIGQSLHYARMTKKKAGIALIIESKRDMHFYNTLINNIEYYKLPITVFIIKGN